MMKLVSIITGTSAMVPDNTALLFLVCGKSLVYCKANPIRKDLDGGVSNGK
jgi:hypothetical protein